MRETNRSLITSRRLVKNGETLEVLVEAVGSTNFADDLFRLSAYSHVTVEPKSAGGIDILCHDETGGRLDVRLSFVNFLLRKRYEGWYRIATRTEPGAAFWKTDNNL